MVRLAWWPTILPSPTGWRSPPTTRRGSSASHTRTVSPNSTLPAMARSRTGGCGRTCRMTIQTASAWMPKELCGTPTSETAGARALPTVARRCKRSTLTAGASRACSEAGWPDAVLRHQRIRRDLRCTGAKGRRLGGCPPGTGASRRMAFVSRLSRNLAQGGRDRGPGGLDRCDAPLATQGSSQP